MAHWLESPEDDHSRAGIETSPFGGTRMTISLPLGCAEFCSHCAEGGA